jgi:hypothetical protein
MVRLAWMRKWPCTPHDRFAPLRVCPCTPQPHHRVLVARDVRGLGLASCSETPHPTGCSRVGTAEVESRLMSRSSRGPRTPGFQFGYAGSNPARDASTRSPRRAHASRAEIGRNDWAAPEPVTGWNPQRLVSSVGFRAPAYEAGGRTFDSCTRCQSCRASSMQSSGLQSRRFAVRVRGPAPNNSTSPSGRRRRIANPLAQARVRSNRTVESSFLTR